MLKKLYYKQNETFDYEFFADVECKTPFDFENVKNVYVELKEGNITPLLELLALHQLNSDNTIYTNKIANCWNELAMQTDETQIIELENIILNINLSKYIPESNAILFLSEECYKQYNKIFKDRQYYCKENKIFRKYKGSDTKREILGTLEFNKITIFLPQGTQAELNKANNIAKELKEEYGIEEVNLFVLNCFASQDTLMYTHGITSIKSLKRQFSDRVFINKIITTNSTGILELQNNECLQVIDCFDIFNDYLK